MNNLKHLISVTHIQGIRIKQQIARLLKEEELLKVLNRKRYKLLAELQARHASNITMYDDVNISLIPSNAEAVAGYVGGLFPTFASLVIRFPHAKHLSIAVNASEDADCLDVENGDAKPEDVAVWVRRQQKRGVQRPCIYASLSTMPSILARLKAAGITRAEVRLWVAWYVGHPVLPAGFDACQYEDVALGRSLDASLCLPSFF